MDRVSIIIPCYNCGRYLSEALDSCLSQSYTDWEGIIVNDGSVDETEEVAMRYVEKDGRFKYFFQLNRGVSAARNVGIRESTGYYILPLDADNAVMPYCLQVSVNCFLTQPKAKLVYGNALLINDNGYGGIREVRELPLYKWDNFIWDNCIDNCAMYRRRDYDNTNGYDENMIYGCEDWDFWLSLLRKDDIVVHVNQELFCYRVRENSRSSGA